MQKEVKLYYCKKLNCKLTRQGCLAMQKRAKKEKLFEQGIITKDNIVFLIDPLSAVPCPCQNPIAKA